MHGLRVSLKQGFRPGLLPSVLVALLLPLLIWLGFWQLQRAEEKSALVERYTAYSQEQPVSLTELQSADSPAYRRVHIHGQFDAQHSVLLDNRTRDGQAGIELLQPFYDQDSQLWLLVNRGWQAWPDRRQAPSLSTPNTLVSLYGWVYQSQGASLQLKPDVITQRWPALLNQLQPQQLWQQLGRDGFAYEIRLEPGPAALRADWPVVALSPEKHLGYAVQWFALALALLVLFFYFGIHHAKEACHDLSPEH